jgi:hypothetical protein
MEANEPAGGTWEARSAGRIAPSAVVVIQKESAEGRIAIVLPPTRSSPARSSEVDVDRALFDHLPFIRARYQ